MTWLWVQKTGQMFHNGDLLGTGYAGRYGGKNNPAMQDIKMTGPLPCGIYRIGDAYTHPHLGPLAMNLTPDAANQMFGRDSFRIHADSVDNPGMASEGCIVLNHGYRQAIADAVAQGDRALEVVADYIPQAQEAP